MEKGEAMSKKEVVPVIDEVHYISPGETLRLEHTNIMPKSFSSNIPMSINYIDGEITFAENWAEHYANRLNDNKIESVCSYLYVVEVDDCE